MTSPPFAAFGVQLEHQLVRVQRARVHHLGHRPDVATMVGNLEHDHIPGARQLGGVQRQRSTCAVGRQQVELDGDGRQRSEQLGNQIGIEDVQQHRDPAG